MQRIRSLQAKGFSEYMQCQATETYFEIKVLKQQVANINTQINFLEESSVTTLNTHPLEKDAVKRDFVISIYGGK